MKKCCICFDHKYSSNFQLFECIKCNHNVCNTCFFNLMELPLIQKYKVEDENLVLDVFESKTLDFLYVKCPICRTIYGNQLDSSPHFIKSLITVLKRFKNNLFETKQVEFYKNINMRLILKAISNNCLQISICLPFFFNINCECKFCVENPQEKPGIKNFVFSSEKPDILF